ncbi:MAG TPA: hypothetical protein VNU74_08985 [Terriglobales bacterium]|nr:hypothetical protein [Terriglobales bacterium]
MKLSYSILIGLLTFSILPVATFCAGQSAPPGQTPDPAQSTQLPAANPPLQNQPVDQPSAQSNSQDQKDPAKKDSAQEDSAQEDTKKKKDDRMFYVMPNYLTVDDQSHVKPISWKEKFAITAKGTFDPYEFVIVGVVAGIRQAENSYPAFGQGAEGYAKRYGAAFADQVDGNIMVGGLYPSILKTDPRYFRLGRGRMSRRFGYAISRVFVARKDSGGSMFNVPEFAGNATAIAISNVYYPAADRGFSASFTNWGVQMGIDAFGNELKEFWPDVHNYLQNRHARREQKQVPKAAAEAK